MFIHHGRVFLSGDQKGNSGVPQIIEEQGRKYIGSHRECRESTELSRVAAGRKGQRGNK